MEIQRSELKRLMKKHGVQIQHVKDETDRIGLKDGVNGFSYDMVRRCLWETKNAEYKRENPDIVKIAIDLIDKKQKEAAKYEAKFAVLSAA